MPDEGSSDELQRQFQAAIAGTELDDLRALTHQLLDVGARAAARQTRPALRRPPLADPVVLTVRVELADSHPPIWRRLDLRSDVTLDVVHQVLQSAFGWTDSHLHRFALGGDPFDVGAEWFLCPFDVEEGEDEGSAASEVRLDETLQQPGDVLSYVYDYGDHWELSLQVEAISPAVSDSPIAVCTDGRRAAPPEDCGSLRDADDLATVLDDPSAFRIDDVNQALRDPYFALREAGMDARLVDLANRLRYSSLGDELIVRLFPLTTPPALPTRGQMEDALRPFFWFLEGGLGNGFALTSAGYLKPADVAEICALLPAMPDWFGKNNREIHAHPLQEFRACLQRIGLLRKHKGRLLTTRVGAALIGNPGGLWDYLASRLVPTGKGEFAEQSALLIVAHAASSPDADLPFRTIARMMNELGWRQADSSPVRDYDLYRVEGSPLPLLLNIGESSDPVGFDDPIHPLAAAFAHYALLRG